MNFDNHQKEIIKAINDGKVYDILSFVKEFGYYEKYQLTLEELQKSFDKREKDRKYSRKNKYDIKNLYRWIYKI